MFEEWVIEAEKMYDNGMSYTAIGKELNKNRQIVSKHIKAKKENKPIVNHNLLNSKMYHDIFEIIDTEEKAYWLGLLYADGNVSYDRTSIALRLKEEDLYHIESFKKFLNASNKIHRKIKDNKYISYELAFRSKKMRNSLIDKGCFPRKSEILKFPTEKQVPKHLIHHFIRGYFDGDGCITTSNNGTGVSVEILGCKDFLSDLIQLDLFKRNKLYSFKHSDVKRVSYSGAKAINILNYIYKDATIYLHRKHDRYNQWLRRLGSTSIEESR